MFLKPLLLPLVFMLPFQETFSQKNVVKPNKDMISLSAIKGASSKVDTLELSAAKNLKISSVKITGDQSSYFRIVSGNPGKISPDSPAKIAFIFEPPANFVGIAQAAVQFKGIDLTMDINGLSTQGLEGENEASLEKILETLGWK